MLSMGKKVSILIIYVLGFLLLPAIFMIVGSQVLGLSGIYLVSVINFSTYLVLCGILLFLSRQVYIEDFKKINNWLKFFGFTMLGLLLTMSAVFLGNLILLLLGVTVQAANQEATEAVLRAMPWLMIITAVIFGPIVEEIIFRLVLMDLFKNSVISLLFSSLIFGLMHVMIGGWIHIITYALAGLAFGGIYLIHRKNIWYVTILHIVHNAVAIGFVFLGQYLLEIYNSL